MIEYICHSCKGTFTAEFNLVNHIEDKRFDFRGFKYPICPACYNENKNEK